MDLLRAHHPLTAGEWESLLVSEGYSPDEARSLAADPPESYVVEFLDGRMVVLDELADRMVATRRVTADEIDADVLIDDQDLSVYTMLRPQAPMEAPALGETEVLEQRGAARLADIAEHVLILEPGTLALFRPGDLVAVRIGRDGAVTVEPVADPVDVDLRPVLDAAVPDGGAAGIYEVIYQQTWDHGLLLEPAVPITEMIERAGYVRRVDMVARTADDIAVDRREMLERLLAGDTTERDEPASIDLRIDLLISLGGEERESIVRTVLARNPGAFDDLDDFEAVTSVLAHIDDRAMAAALDADNGPVDGDDPVGRVLLAALATVTTLSALGPRRIRPATLHLAASLLLRMGQGERSESVLREAMAEDETWLIGHHGLYAFALIRSDLPEALAQLRQVPGGEDEPIYGFLERIVAGAGPEPGRNDPCWCGSGRKYKKCHIGRPRITPNQRSQLLLAKAAEYMRMSHFHVLVDALADQRASVAGERYAHLLADDPLADDVALIEGGVLESFLDACGPLLPAEDAMLAQQWLLRGRSVYEVLQARPGEGFTLRDLRTGDRIDVTERRGSADVQAGQFLCVRVVEEDGREVIYGGIEPVDAALRADLIEALDGGDPFLLVELLSRRYAPTQMRTMTGEEMVICAGTYSIPDPSGLARKLSRRYGKREGGVWTWLDGTRVLGTITQDEGPVPLALTVEAMSVERYETMTAHLLSAAPGAELVDESRSTAAEMLERVEAGDAPPPPPPEAADPAVQEALAEFVRDYERSWLDEAIPALGGRTPREAVEDPTTRDDVIRLLDSFPQEESPGMMSTARLREMLGL